MSSVLRLFPETLQEFEVALLTVTGEVLPVELVPLLLLSNCSADHVLPHVQV